MKEDRKIYHRFIEMAYVGSVSELSIDVYTDHTPSHFHVLKKDWFEVKISITSQEVIGYKWQKNGKEISSKELKDLQKWLKEKNKDEKDITNLSAIKYLWKAMNG
jgi:hypothetical protein